MITDPTSLFAFLAIALAGIFWLSRLPALAALFKYLPPVIWAYFVPMLATTFGLIPQESVTYAWIQRYLLPFSLFLLMLTVDLKAILKLGPTALIMMVAGTAGIVIGGPVALMIFQGWLPPEAWKGFAALSGSWIGGTANMVAIADSVGASPDALGPIIVIDTVVGYGWMGVLIFLSTFQESFDKKIGADNEAIKATNRRLAELDNQQRPIEMRDLVFIVGLAMGAAVLAVNIGRGLPTLGDPTIISNTTWAILIVVTAGLMLSFTPLQNLEQTGASRIGYYALYLLLTAIGAQADLKTVLDTPVFFLAGATWIMVHIAFLFMVAWFFKAPLFFVATGSMANIGGAASAPIVAGVYHRAMAPVGALMGVAGYILGIYAALLCAYLLGWVAGG